MTGLRKSSTIQMPYGYTIDLVLDCDSGIRITARGPHDWSEDIEDYWNGIWWKFKNLQKGVKKASKVIAKQIKNVEEFEQSSKVMVAITELRIT